MAEKREWLSPYNFVQNNPILRIDPDGRLDEECDWCEDLIKSLPDMSLEINVTVGAQAGVKIGEVFEADVTVINTEILKDETSIKDGEFNSSKQLGPLKATPEGSVENNGKMTVENSVALKGLGFGGKIGQKQEIDGDLRSSNYKQFSEKGAELGGFGGKIVKETDQGGNSTVKKEGSFSIGAKLLLGVELKLKIGK